MNGFLYLANAGVESRPDLNALLPFQGHARVRKTLLPGNEMLVTWGSPAGDIHCSQQGEDSLLILCGYVGEVRGGPEITGQEQAAAFLHKCLAVDASNAALKALLERLHGSFSLFFRDFRRGTWLGVSDRVASRPLWMMHNGSERLASSHPAAMACAVPAVPIDLGALGAFLLYGGPVEPRKSLFTGIEAISPGTIVQSRDGGPPEDFCWYRFQHQANERRSLSDWIELAAERLVRSAGRIAGQCDRPVIFFSGGVDSRLAAAALKAAGAEPLLLTLGDARNLEVRVAEQAAKAMNLDHSVILRDAEWYLRSLPRTVFETGGSFLWTHGHFAQAISRIRQQHPAEVFLLGDFCEAFSKLLCAKGVNRLTLQAPDEFARDFDQTRLPLYRPRNRDRTLSLLNPRIRGEVEAALARDIARRFSRLSEVSPDPRIVIDHFARWESAATISTFFMFLDVRSAGPERNLMFDLDLHELLETMPSRFREGVNLGALLVKRLAPRAARVVNSNSLLPICWPPAVHNLSKRCKPMLGKARRLILGNSHRTTGAWPEKVALYATNQAWRSCFEGILGEGGLFPEDLFDLGRVRHCWQSLLAGQRECAGDVEKLVQFGLLSRFRRGMNSPVEEIDFLKAQS
jgi:hypothetical protein